MKKPADVSTLRPSQMLDLHDRFLSGAPMSEEERSKADAIALAAAFGAEAFMRHQGCDGGATIALLRSFLTALVDPLHQDLDYLRRDPNAAQPSCATMKKERE